MDQIEYNRMKIQLKFQRVLTIGYGKNAIETPTPKIDRISFQSITPANIVISSPQQPFHVTPFH
jgi:hypothetical protein